MGFFDGIANRIADRSFGDKSLDLFAQELVQALRTAKIELSEPVNITMNGQGPALRIEDTGGNAQAVQFIRREEGGVQSSTLGVRAESDGLVANAVLPSLGMTLTRAEQQAYYERGTPYVWTQPGGPGETNVGEGGTEGVGYPPASVGPSGAQVSGLIGTGSAGGHDHSDLPGFDPTTEQLLYYEGGHPTLADATGDCDA